MAVARILGQDTVSDGEVGWWDRFGQHGWYFLDNSGTPNYQPPTYLTNFAITVLGNGLAPSVDGPKNPGGLAMPAGGVTQVSSIDNSFSDPTAKGLAVAITPDDDDPHLLSIYTYRRDGGVALKFTVHDTSSTAITPVWAVPTPLSGFGSGGYWMRVAYSGAIVIRIEKVSGSSSIPLTGLAFGPYHANHAGITQGFVGHGVF